jgi:hypothetical protein
MDSPTAILSIHHDAGSVPCSESALVPGDGAVLGETNFDDWLSQARPAKAAGV